MGNINIPLLDFGGKGQPLHFAHANGYPPDCYVNLIKQLTPHYHVFSLLQRPLWPGTIPEEINDWYPLTDDFLHLLDEQHITSVIGIGHSMGGVVTLRAASHDPSRFKALVLIDPVLFPPYMILFWSLIKHLGLGYRFHPLVVGALRRRRQFDSIESLMRGYRCKSIFKYLDDKNLATLIKGLLKPRLDGSYELQYSPEWEARIYVTGIWHDWDLWRGLPKLKIPLMIIRGSETSTFLASTARRVKRIHPSTRIETIERSTHLVPIEKPDEVSKVILSFLEEVL
jgi:pimeloyl-ACP methyl ester carboxylesterase